MHPHFDFTPAQIIWTLTFAAHLVLLVVLLGRERTKRFPLFTASVALTAVRLLIEQLLSRRLPMVTFQAFDQCLMLISSLLSLLVLVEVVRRGFLGAAVRGIAIATGVLFAVTGVVLYLLGRPWPPTEAYQIHSQVDLLQMIQFFSSKLDLLGSLLAIGVLLLMLAFGRRFAAGLRSHTFLITSGLALLGATWIGVIGYWQHLRAQLHPGVTMEEAQRIYRLGTNLALANEAILVLVVIFWVMALWIDEPGSSPVIALNVDTNEEVISAVEPSITAEDQAAIEAAEVVEQNPAEKNEQ